ncbi:hypothetical protein Tco_1437666 [Tanacetum coccineum]
MEIIAKYEDSYVSDQCAEAISKKERSIISQSIQETHEDSSCNEDFMKYEGPRPSITQARALNEKSSKNIPPATSQPSCWRVCYTAEGVPPDRRLCRPALRAHIFHFTLEET